MLTALTPGWTPGKVHLSVHPAILVEEDETLVIGLSVLLCMDGDDVAVLVEDALMRRRALAASPVSGAVRIASGGLGRGLRDRGSPWLSGQLMARIDASSARLHAAYQEWVMDVRHGDEAKFATHQAHDTLCEAWGWVLQRWLVPALDEGFCHLAPFTGLRAFVLGAADTGILEGKLASSTGLGHLLEEDYEQRLAWQVPSATDSLRPLQWQDHAVAVSIPQWQQATSQALAALQQANGHTLPASVGAILDSLDQGWGETAAAVLEGPRYDEGHADEPSFSHSWHPYLTSAIYLAALEVPGTQVQWRWPFGPEVISDYGTVLDVHAAVAAGLEELVATGRGAGLRQWLSSHGIDIDTPLRLGHGPAPGIDRVAAAFPAYRQLTKNVMVLLSQQTIRVLDETYVEATRQETRARMVGGAQSLQPMIEAVEAQELSVGTNIQVRDVTHVDISSIMGMIYWRLAVSTADQTYRYFGVGPGDEIKQSLAVLVGDRLTSKSIDRRKWLRRVHATWALGGVSLGLLLVIGAFISGSSVLAMLGLGLGLIALALLPDAIAVIGEGRRSGRRRLELLPPLTRME